MFENIMNFFKKLNKKEKNEVANSKDAAKERLHLVLMQDRANVSADFLELMKQEIIEVIKKYIDVDESAIDVRLTNKENEDGTNGAPALYANIPIVNIKNEAKKEETKKEVIMEQEKQEEQSKETFVKNEENENKQQELVKKETNKEDNNENEKEEQQEEKAETEEKNQQLKSENIGDTEN